MTVRKLWLLVLLLVVVISVSINAVILASLTDKYFRDYMVDSYDKHVSQIIQYTEKALLEEEFSYKQMAIELETHLEDPIIRIKLYSPEGELLVDVDDNYHVTGTMMNGRGMGNMMTPTQDKVDQYKIEFNGRNIGILNITRHSSAENSFVARMFKSALFMNSLYAMVIAIIISIVVGVFISKKMSKALKETASMAQDIHFGEVTFPKDTSIREINTIRESLKSLQGRLKLKQKSRKALIDELVHQTRTPLTVLKSHLEAIEDGIVKVTGEEIDVCQNQIENITTIISNMSGMIDASRDIVEVKIKNFDFNQLIVQIVAGLKTQFDKKVIKLELISNQKITMATDKYKLSQSIYNVLTNAYKYTQSRGNVRISYTTNNETLTLKVQDTGIGIEQKEIKKIFNAYYRSDSAVDSDGEGIGLYIVKENLSMIKGSIKVKSQKGVGSSFIIEVPVNLHNRG